MRVRVFEVVVAVSLALAARLRAQTVRGVVTDDASRDPVPGAVVTLLDSAGHFASRTITGSTGRFALPIVGRISRLRVVRIGFRPSDAPFPIAYPHADTSVSVMLHALPTLIDPVQVSDASRCDPRPDRLEALALWEQARAGLLATIVGREAHPARLDVVYFNRLIPAGVDRATSISLRHATLQSNRPFFAARPVGEFARSGYISEDERGRTYYGPDPDGLLDATFAATHCFSLARDSVRHPNELGLAFEPAKGVHVVDIAGALWIDARAPQLRSLDYRYVHIDDDAARVKSGGSMSFRTSPNGVTIIDDWKIRSPRSVKRVVVFSGATGPRRQSRIDVEEAGARIVSATWPDGESWRDSTWSFTGRVTQFHYDTRPVVNALVWLLDTDDSTRTDSTGAFAFRDLLPGPYRVFVSDSIGAPLHFQMNEDLTVDLDSVKPATTRIRLQDTRSAVAGYCAHQPGGGGSLLLFGDADLSDGTPAASVRTEVTWLSPRTNKTVTIRPMTTSNGSFFACGVEVATPVTIGIADDSTRAPRVVKTFAPGSMLESVNLTIPLAIPTFRTRIFGAFDFDTGAPVDSVMVVDNWTGRVLGATDVHGAARLTNLPVGRVTLLVERPGYQPSTITVNVSPNDTVPITHIVTKTRPR